MACRGQLRAQKPHPMHSFSRVRKGKPVSTVVSGSSRPANWTHLTGQVLMHSPQRLQSV